MAKVPASLKQPCADPYELKGDKDGNIRAREAALAARHDRKELVECGAKQRALAKATDKRDGVLEEIGEFVDQNKLLTRAPLPKSRPKS